MATYLVTGAAGFIGSNLARSLLARGEVVRGIDDFSTGRRENILDLGEMDFVEGDVTDLHVLRSLMRGVDYVFHEAAVPSVPRSVEQPLECHNAGSTGTLTVLEAAREAGSVQRLVYASSSSAYGDTPTLPKQESMPTCPLSPYAVAKLTGEHYARVYAHVHGLPTVCLRYFNIFGPHQDPTSTYAAVIPKFIEAIGKGESPVIYGDGEQTRDFTFIENVVEANLKACAAPEAVGLWFNIGCGARTSLLQLVRIINDILGTDVAPRHEPPRPGDVRDSYADITLARNLLGYRGEVTLREGLRRTIHWYQTCGVAAPQHRSLQRVS